MSAKHVRKATTAFCAWNDETVTDSDKAEGGTCEHDHSKDEYAESVLDNTPFSYAVADNTRPFCFTSTEARWLIRDGDRGGRGRKSEGSTADTARKRPERPWTAARTMEVLRRCPLAIAQRLVHCPIAVSTAVLGQSHKDNIRCTAVE